MRGQRLASLSLRIDAIYCLVLGAFVAVAAPGIAPQVSLPAPLLVIVGVAVVLWAGLVEWMRRTLPTRLALRIVMLANIAATVAVAAVSLSAAALVGTLVVLAIAVDIALFAGSQALALGQLPAPAP